MGNKVNSSASLDLRNNNLYVGSDSDNLTCLDTRDGTFKWAYKTGGDVRTTPAIYEDKVVFGSNDGTQYILNKYTGNPELTYNPGTYLFNSPITSSSVVYGDVIFFAGNDGYLYSLDGDKLNTPISVFVYYIIIVIIVVLAVIIGLITFIKRRRK